MTPRRTPGCIHLRWLAIRSDDPAEASWRALLDDAERAQADRFHFAADRLAYTAAHAMTRQMLSAAGELPPQSWRFATGPGGKPYIDPALGRPALRFNLSHTRGMAACAVCWGDELGVDVEPPHDGDFTLEIARDQFAAAEAALLAGLEPPARRIAFSRVWTLKEAYVKATGEGLEVPLDCFAFSLDPLAIRFYPPPRDDVARWQFFEWRPDGYLLALAVRHDANDPVRVDAGPMDAASSR
jgi:4'-phosphopantetheinyl transferase